MHRSQGVSEFSAIKPTMFGIAMQSIPDLSSRHMVNWSGFCR
ncbi:MAG: hypothetical protein V7L12_26015 [Nostoc sp.]